MSNVAEAQTPTKAETKGGVIPYLNVDGAAAAAKFYEKAFGARIVAQMPVDEKGRTMHIHLHLSGSSIMLSDFFEEHGHAKVSPQGYSLVIMATDIEAQYQRAVDAGCKGLMAPQKMFWGDTFGSLLDPYGVNWGMNQPG